MRSRWLVAVLLGVGPCPPAEAQRFTGHGHAVPVRSLRFSPDGKTLASADEHGLVNLWDVPTGKKLHTVGVDGSSRARGLPSLAIAPDGATLALCWGSGLVQLYAVATGKEVRSVSAGGWGLGVAFAPDGKSLAVTDFDSDLFRKGSPAANTVLVLDLATGKVRARLPTTEVGWTRLNGGLWFSHDGRVLVAGGQATYLWDTTTGKLRTIADSEPLTQVRRRAKSGPHSCGVRVWVSPDCKTVVRLNRDDVELWEVATGRQRASLPIEGRSPFHDLDAVEVSPDLKLVASGDKDGNLRLWDLRRQQKLVTARCHSDRVTAAAFSADGKMLATGSWDRTVKVWELSDLLTPRGVK